MPPLSVQPVLGWADDLAVFEMELKGMRVEAEETYS
jgi:hypothetical protein